MSSRMLTYAAIKFTCEPRNVYVIRAREHVHFGKKFFVGKVMCDARWKCKQNCSKQHLDEDDYRPAEVLLMGNSRKIIIATLQQYHSNLTVIEPRVSPTKLEITNKKKRNRDELNQSMSPTNYKRIKSEQECGEDQLNRTVSPADEFAVTPSKHRIQMNEATPLEIRNINFKDHNENAIMADTRTPFENIDVQ